MQNVKTYIEMIKNIPASISILDKEIKYLFASKGWLRDYNLTEEIIGKSHYEVFQNIPKEWKAIHQEVLKTGIEREGIEDHFLADDGSDIYINWVVTPWFDNNNEVGGLIFKSQDVSQRVKARKDLEMAQEMAKIGSWSFNIHSGKISWSKEMYNIFPEDITKGEPDFEKHRSTIHPDDVEHWENTVGEAVSKAKNYTMQFRSIHPNKIVWIEAMGRVKTSRTGEVLELFGTCQDITEKVLQSEKVNRLNQELREFSYRISHDLKSPLTSIEGLINLCREEKDDPELIEESIENMELMVHKLKDTIDSSISVIRNEAIELSLITFSAQDICDRIIHLFGPQINKEKINYQFQGRDIKLTTDRSLLESVVENLVSNSIKYRDELKDSFIKVIFESDDNFIYLKVSDNGLGIDEKFHDKLFNMFSRFHSVSEGTGLGLYTLKKSVERMGGSIKFKSVKDEGTEFVVTLPRYVSKA